MPNGFSTPNDSPSELPRRQPDADGAENSEAARVARLRNAATARSFRVAPFRPTQTPTAAPVAKPNAPPQQPMFAAATGDRRTHAAAAEIQADLITRIDARIAAMLDRSQLADSLDPLVRQIAEERKLVLSQSDIDAVLRRILDDLVGFGPLEPLLADPTVADILVNGANQVYVERGGRLELTNIVFNDDAHVLNVITRIVSRVGRRVDESTPLVDARLPDGSRFNAIIPPLALDGPMISIRKFSDKAMGLEQLIEGAAMSPAMATLLGIAIRARLNILICGGTGTGKTTLLNALSRMIPDGERVLTIEDAAELKLQQPHVGRLETRPPNLEGKGEITIRDLFRNALRMRPDRIIVGEIRGGEAYDMMQAMNSGHDGSLGTMHASGPREAITRLENILLMSAGNMPARAIRAQIAGSLDLIVQVTRMHDGKRRITSITEIVGMEGEVITMQELFSFAPDTDKTDGSVVTGRFVSSGLRPYFLPKADLVGQGRELMKSVAPT